MYSMRAAQERGKERGGRWEGEVIRGGWGGHGGGWGGLGAHKV